jgi:hypothetical protein
LQGDHGMEWVAWAGGMETLGNQCNRRGLRVTPGRKRGFFIDGIATAGKSPSSEAMSFCFPFSHSNLAPKRGL